MIRIVIYILLLVIAATSAHGPDPWDHWQEQDKAEEITKNNGRFSDVFFKKVLKLLVARGQIKETENGSKDILLNFVFSQSEFQKIEKLSSLTVPLVSSELREVYGLLSDRLLEVTYTQIFTETIIDRVSRLFFTYYIHALIVISMCMIIYYLRLIKWSPILIIRISLIILFIIIYLWECKVAVEVANKKFYSSMQEIPSWWSWITGTDYGNMKFDMPSQWEYLHPSNILTKLCTKFVLVPLKEIFLYFDGMSNDISKKFSFPFNSIIYVFLTSLYSIISFVMTFMCIMHIVFGIPFKLSYFGLHINTAKKSSTKSSDASENGEDIKSLLAASVAALSNMRNSNPLPPINITVNTVNREVENRQITNCTANMANIKCNNCNLSTDNFEDKIENQGMESTANNSIPKKRDNVLINKKYNTTDSNDNKRQVSNDLISEERNLLNNLRRRRRKTTEL